MGIGGGKECQSDLRKCVRKRNVLLGVKSAEDLTGDKVTKRDFVLLTGQKKKPCCVIYQHSV